jgi:hypothetical protein
MSKNTAPRKEQTEKKLTCIGLNTRSDLTRTDFIEKRHVLTQDGAKILFPNTLRVDFSRPNPNGHVGKGTHEHAHTY